MPRFLTTTKFILCFLFLFGNLAFADEKGKNKKLVFPDGKDGKTYAEEIMKKCIEKHGGWDNFSAIRDIIFKMNVVSHTEQGDSIENIVEQYFRLPNKLRSEIIPLVDPPTKLSWDGQNFWQLVKDQLEKNSNEKQSERLQESLRFMRMMVLTNLFEKGSKLDYFDKVEPKSKNFNIHVIAQTDEQGDTIKLYISDNSYTLLGGEFYWQGTTTLFKVFFDKQTVVAGISLPQITRLYKEDKLVLEAKLRAVKINELKNGNSFFSDLFEKPK